MAMVVSVLQLLEIRDILLAKWARVVNCADGLHNRSTSVVTVGKQLQNIPFFPTKRAGELSFGVVLADPEVVSNVFYRFHGRFPVSRHARYLWQCVRWWYQSWFEEVKRKSLSQNRHK